MPTLKRRRWFSLSLRTVMMGMTLISVGFAWFLHHRWGKFVEGAPWKMHSSAAPSRLSSPVTG
jgi:hypothetical protein